MLENITRVLSKTLIQYSIYFASNSILAFVPPIVKV